MTRRWIDTLNLRSAPKKEEKPEDPRSCAEIAADMWNRIKGKKTEGGENNR